MLLWFQNSGPPPPPSPQPPGLVRLYVSDQLVKFFVMMMRAKDPESLTRLCLGSPLSLVLVDCHLKGISEKKTQFFYAKLKKKINLKW